MLFQQFTGLPRHPYDRFKQTRADLEGGFSRVPKETLKEEMTQKHSKPTVNWPENLHFQAWFLRKVPSIQSSESVKC